MSKNDSGYIKRPLPQKFLNLGLALLGIGLVLGIIAYVIDPQRASYSYLTSFMFLISLGVGSLFLVSLEYLAGAVWSTPFRRISEFFAGTIPYLVIISIPLLFTMHDLFHWTHSAVVQSDAVLKGKESYLNIPFFVVRNIAIFFIWTLFYFLITTRSRKQDESGDQSLTKTNIKLSTGFIFLFAITITMSGVDWMMSLEPHWYSTIFGVYYFSGTVWCALAALTLAVVLLRENGYLIPGLKDDHYYSLGTMMFAFTAFWGYIAFSQYMLIWYADLPEETSWFFHRWEGGWMYASIIFNNSSFCSTVLRTAFVSCKNKSETTEVCSRLDFSCTFLRSLLADYAGNGAGRKSILFQLDGSCLSCSGSRFCYDDIQDDDK